MHVDHELPATAVPPNFRNHEEFAGWRVACQRASERFGANELRVAPGCEFRAAYSDALLRSGDIVRPYDHFSPAVCEELLRRGVVIRGTPGGELVALCPADARYVVGRSVVTASGAILLPGAEIHAFLLQNGQKDLDRLIAAGVVEDRYPQPSEAATPADRAVAVELQSLAAAEASLSAAESAWLDEDTPATTRARRAALDAVARCELRVTRARQEKSTTEAAEKVAERARLLKEIDALEAEKPKASRDRVRAQEGVRQAAIALARALGDDARAADAEYSAHDRWRVKYGELHGISADQIHVSLAPTPDLPRLFAAIVAATGGSVAAHELFGEVER